MMVCFIKVIKKVQGTAHEDMAHEDMAHEDMGESATHQMDQAFMTGSSPESSYQGGVCPR